MASKERPELNYWPSFVDIFASLFFIFLILFAVYYTNEGKKNKAIRQDWEELATLLKEHKNLIDLDTESMNFVIRDSVFFNHNKSELNDNGVRLAHKLGTIFGNYLSKEDRAKKYSIIIEGHTDSTGDPFRNDPLSLERANNLISVMKQTMKTNIPPNQLESILIPVGYGERKLKYFPQKDGYKHAGNRRVEIKIVPKFNEAAKDIWDEVMNAIIKGEYN